MNENRVKVNLELDSDIIPHLKSLGKMFMMNWDDIVNLILKMEMKKKLSCHYE